jgi:hypothetical protein
MTSPFPIGNTHNPPLNNVDGNLVNKYGTTLGGIPFSNTSIPNGSHTLPPAGSNVQGASSIYPKGGGKNNRVNRGKINKISRKYKMRRSKRYIRKIKSRLLRKHSRSQRHYRTRRHSRSRRSRRHYMRGGTPGPMTTPNYPAGHVQASNNVGSISNVYSTGGLLSPKDVGMANPPPHQLVANANMPDNLNHNTLNSFGNSGAGSGFLSRGSF